MISITGWASRRFGRKRLFIFAMVGNTIATAMCGTAASLEAEVFWRFMQGVLSAPLLAVGQSLVISAFPSNRRGFATGLWGAAGVGAVVFAPVLGGYLIEYVNWALDLLRGDSDRRGRDVWSLAFIPKSLPSPARGLDWLGFATLIVLVGTLQLGLSRGERLQWFESTEIRIHFLIAAITLAMVVHRVATKPGAILESALFRDRNFVVSVTFMLLFGGLTTLPVVLVPLMLQQISGFPRSRRGGDDGQGVGTMTTFLVVGFIMHRLDPRAVLCVGFLFYACANLYMSTWTDAVDPTSIMFCLIVMGAASGSTYIPIVALALGTLPRRVHTEAITFMFLIFNIGSATAVAAIFALHSRLIQINRSVLVEHITETNVLLKTPAFLNSIDLDTPGGLATISTEISRQAELIAYVNSYLVIGVAAALVIPLVLIVRKPREGDLETE